MNKEQTHTLIDMFKDQFDLLDTQLENNEISDIEYQKKLGDIIGLKIVLSQILKIEL